MNPSKLKVVELRAELASRGLDTKGNKAALVDRLQEALDKESGGVPSEKSLDQTNDGDENNDNESDLNETVADNTLSQLEESESADEANTSVTDKEEPVTEKDESKDLPEEGSNKVEENSQPDKSEPDQTDPAESKKTEDSKEETIIESNVIAESVIDPVVVEEPVITASISEVTKAEPTGTSNNQDQDQTTEDNKENEKDHPMAETNGTPVKKENFEEEPVQDEQDVKMDHDGEVNVKTEVTTEPVEVKEERDRDTERQDRKRKRSSSPHRKDWSSVKSAPREDEPEMNEKDVVLSWYDSDLNLLIDKESLLKASPLSEGGFGYIWAGTRGTHGYTSGHLVYQVKLTEYCDISHLEDEPNPNVLRVGWSALGTSTQLGEEALSYGYGGTGKVSVNSKFSDYGRTYGLNDVVTAYLDFNDSSIVISYAINDEFLGEAFTLSEEELKGRALVPHILTKNIKFEVNFGQLESPWFPVKDIYTFVNQVPLDQAVTGPRKPEKKSDCEMVMMCGLPGCGKTYWANKHFAANPEKLYNIIGTNALIDKMKVMGLPRKANYHGRWDILIEKCTKCLQRLMDIGCRRRRNFILDQTNVYPAAQRRKMRNFEGFTRKAVVIVPTDEEFKRRVNEREQLEGKDVPDSAVMEMKANFTLPDKNIFDEVIYTELEESESRKLVRKYNDEAIDAGYPKRGPQGPPAKRFRSDFQQPQSGGRHEGFRGRPNPPAGHQFRRGGLGGSSRGGSGGSRGGGWPQRPGGGADRWRDNRGGGSMMRNHGGSGGYNRQQSGSNDRQPQHGGWRGGNNGGGRGPRESYGGGPDRNRGGGGYDRNQGNRQPRGGGTGGSYNRDNRKDNRMSQNKPRGVGGGSMASSGSGQWGQYQSGGQQAQAWTGQQQQSWQQQPQQQQQQWANYQQQPQQQQQQWKGYNQGSTTGYAQQQAQTTPQTTYGQQGTTQGYGQQYGTNWQQYGNYGGYGQQNWGQNWQQWYGQGTGAQGNAAVQPPPTK